MKREYAEQIAQLLNTRNELVRTYTDDTILEKADDFIYEVKDEVIAACVEVKKVQWYQWEVCHLTVASHYEGQHLGSLMISNAEEKAKSNGARIIQCTIRQGNIKSERAFSRNDYKKVSEFYYSISGNVVGVWQKVVSNLNNAA